MSVEHASIPPSWLYYQDRSAEADASRADDFGHGREEQLWETLKVIESGEPFTEACRSRLDRVAQNRAKKHRRLRLHLASLAGAVRRDDSPHVRAIAVADDMARVRRALSPVQWDVEWRLAGGETYGEVARTYELTPGALKVRVQRWRALIRTRIAG
jgi:hypothetical protein